MKLARTINEVETTHRGDIDRIREVFASYQILISESDIVLAWATYSDSLDVPWAELPEKDEDVYLAIIKQLKVEDW